MKKQPRMYYMGRRLNSPLQRFAAWVKYLLKLGMWILILVGIIVSIGMIARQINPKVVYESVQETVILDNLTAKVNELKGELINDLKKCESQGYSESDGLVTFDPHPTKKQVQVASFGQFQQKKSFVQYYYTKLYGQTITGKEAILIALDEEKASQLTSDVIFKTENGLSNWYNCSNKLGLKGRLAIINELQK